MTELKETSSGGHSRAYRFAAVLFCAILVSVAVGSVMLLFALLAVFTGPYVFLEVVSVLLLLTFAWLASKEEW